MGYRLDQYKRSIVQIKITMAGVSLELRKSPFGMVNGYACYIQVEGMNLPRTSMGIEQIHGNALNSLMDKLGIQTIASQSKESKVNNLLGFILRMLDSGIATVSILSKGVPPPA